MSVITCEHSFEYTGFAVKMQVLIGVEIRLTEVSEFLFLLFSVLVLILVCDEQLSDHVLDVVKLHLHVSERLHLGGNCLVNYFSKGENARKPTSFN